MFSTSRSYKLRPRTAQLCRVLLRVRLIVSVLAVLLLLLGSNPLRVSFVVAFVFAIVISALAYVFWRRILRVLQRHPILFSLDTFLSLFILTGTGRAAPFLIFTMVTSVMAGVLYRWGGMLSIVVLQVLCYGIAVIAETGTSNLIANQTLLVPATYYIVVGFAGLWIRRMLDDADRIDESRRAMEVAGAEERERARLARDMHDSLAKTVRGIAFAAAALPNWIRRDQDRAVLEAGRIAAASEVAAREARDLMTDLRTGDIDRPLLDTVRAVTTEWGERTGTPVSTQLAEVELPVAPRHELVNVLKEALTNIERHAGASQVTVRLNSEDDEVRLQVADDGDGFDAAHRDDFASAGHYGLLGMTERSRRIHGDLDVVSAPGDGCVITLVLPATPPETEASEDVDDPQHDLDHHPKDDSLTVETR